MVCVYNINTSPNRYNNNSKHPLHKTNLWIPFSYLRAGVINPSGSQIRQNRVYGKVCAVGWTEHLFSDALWIIYK
jgi:hypothetical protein